MKRKELTELRTETLDSLKKLAREKKKETQTKGMAVLGGREKNLKMFKNLRRDLAQTSTLICEKEILEKLKAK